MNEVDQALTSNTGQLEGVRSQLLQAAKRCASIADILSGTGNVGVAATIREGARRLNLGVYSLDEIVRLCVVIERGFTEDGPRIPALVRGFADLPAVDDSPALLPPTMVGIFRCDREGRFITHFRDNAAKMIGEQIPRPYETDEGRRRRAVSSFSLRQQLLMNTFFMQEGGKLILPTLLDVFGYFLQEWCEARYHVRPEWFYESDTSNYQYNFIHDAAEVLYKIRHSGSFTPNEFHRAKGLRKFGKVLGRIRFEYGEILDHRPTLEELERIALREMPELLY